MKNILKLIPFLFLFLACEQGVIFYDIAREIELEDPNIIGNVNSIVKLGGNLYTQNGNVYTKPLTTVRGWVEMSSPGRVVMLASDDSYLYALTAGQTDDEGDEHKYALYASNGGNGNWSKITESTETIALFDNGAIGTAADNTTGRKAYARIGGEVKPLKEWSLEAKIEINGASTSTVAAANLSSGDYFSDTRAFCSNGTNTLYKIEGGTLSYKEDSDTEWTSSISISDVTTMVYAYDKLYVGTDLGLEQVTLDAIGGVPTGNSNLDSNAEATMGEKEILSVAFYNDAIYAGAISTTSTKTNGLWGYYPSRGNWNYE